MAMRNAGKLHPASKKYLLWAILLMVLSVTTYAIGPDVFLKANEGNHGADGEIIGFALSIVRVGCQWIGTAVGAALIGAAVVIQVLAPRESETEEDLDSTDP
jgi:hypothetical protein